MKHHLRPFFEGACLWAILLEDSFCLVIRFKRDCFLQTRSERFGREGPLCRLVLALINAGPG